MRKTALLCVAAALIASAQEPAQQLPPPPAVDMGAATDAMSWASDLRERFRRMQNPVVRAYGLARLGAELCPADSGIGSDLFREAIGDLNYIPEDIFKMSTKVLPVASFSGLWKVVSDAGLKCDPGLPQPDSDARYRHTNEKRQAATYLAQAATLSEGPDRSAQLADAALEAGDPYQLDVTPATPFLIKLRVDAPELADGVFLGALDFVKTVEIPNVHIFADLGNYLFIDPKYATEKDPVLERTTYTVGNSTFWNWKADHETTNPDTVAQYIGAAVDVLRKPDVVTVDPAASYALAFQLLAKARDLELAGASELEKIVDQLESDYPSTAAKVKDKLGSSLGSGENQDGFGRLIARVRAALTAGHFDQAREILRHIDGVDARAQVASVIDFHEAVYALAARNIERAMSLAGALPGGVKRAILYAGIATLSKDGLVAASALHLGVKDCELLSSEQRIVLLPALAAAAKNVDAEEAQGVLSQVIAAYNDVNTSPRRRAFNPKGGGAFDGNRTLFGVGGFEEVVQAAERRTVFSLHATGVTAFSLDTFIAQAKDMEFPRLVAAVEGLRNELQLTKAYLALARLRLKVAGAVK